MIPMFLILFVATSVAFIVDGAASALNSHKAVNKCEEYDCSHGGC